ncbi:MAG: metallophosphoesterase family protein [Myxococcales bacterium]|nr:metallophosphoesterase family protein [Myxococcales bacterium]
MTLHREIALPSGEPIRIAVISDTHSSAHPNAIAHVAKASPHLILHAGDIGESSVLEPFEEVAETLAVRGNIDGKDAGPDVITITLSGDDGYAIRIVMKHIALYGPRIRRDAKALAQKYDAHLLICGHSHVPFLGQEGKLIAFNPGSIGPRRHPLPITFGLLEFGPGQSSIRHIDCVTGEPWLP